MQFWELLILAVGLAMDAFAVSICKGVCFPHVSLKKALIPGLWFGAFQAGMPLVGYLIGSRFEQMIKAFDHWIAFVLLGVIGINMIKEALEKEEPALSCAVTPEEELQIRSMFLLAIATSIDALAVGITFAFLSVSIIPAITLIGIITLILSAVGVKIGSLFGLTYKSRAELAGGGILIFLGIKILIEHLFFQG